MSRPSISEAKPTDALVLNVGGEGFLHVVRRTLTQVEASLLEAKFSGRWEERVLDSEGRIYVDHSMAIFKPLVDYLRNKCYETQGSLAEPPLIKNFGGNQDLFKELLHIFEHYGLFAVSYPYH